MALTKSGDKDKRGGLQLGAGRPRITDDSLRKIRPAHVLKAWPEEYEIIKRFVKHVRADQERCRLMVDFMDTVLKKANGATGIMKNPNKRGKVKEPERRLNSENREH